MRRKPRYVDPKVLFRRSAAAAVHVLWGRKRRVLRDGRAYRDYFTMRMQFDTTNADRLLGPVECSPPLVLDYLDRLFNYCVASDWGRKPVAAYEYFSAHSALARPPRHRCQSCR